MQIFLVPVIVNGDEQLFPSVVAFNLIFFICMILGIVLTIAVIFMRSKVIKLCSASSSAAPGVTSQVSFFQMGIFVPGSACAAFNFSISCCCA